MLPELPALRMAADEHGQHKDVYAHTLQVLDQAIGLEERGPDGEPVPDLVLRWAALLHDIGKPETRRFVALRAAAGRSPSTTTRWSAPGWPGPG